MVCRTPAVVSELHGIMPASCRQTPNDLFDRGGVGKDLENVFWWPPRFTLIHSYTASRKKKVATGARQTCTYIPPYQSRPANMPLFFHLTTPHRTPTTRANPRSSSVAFFDALARLATSKAGRVSDDTAILANSLCFHSLGPLVLLHLPS